MPEVNFAVSVTGHDRNDTQECHFGRLDVKTSGIAKEERENLKLAGRQGFEPRYRGPEPRVLPLDDLPVPARAGRMGQKLRL